MTPFELGFMHGQMTREFVTSRQVGEQYPDWSADEIERYQNGRGDGIVDDLYHHPSCAIAGPLGRESGTVCTCAEHGGLVSERQFNFIKSGSPR